MNRKPTSQRLTSAFVKFAEQGSDGGRGSNRTDLLEQRSGLMEAWAHYLGDQGGKVVKLAARR